jgi:PAS domain S-box-containing protein
MKFSPKLMQHFMLRKGLEETGWRQPLEQTSIEQLIYLLPILFSIWITITVGVYTIRRHRVIGARSFAAVLFCEAIWTTGYLFESISTTLEGKIFWDNLQWLPTFVLPLLFLLFVYRYSNKTFQHPLRTWIILSVIPFLSLVLIYSNYIHGWAINSIQFIDLKPFSEYSYHFSKILWIGLVYIYAITIWAVVLLTRLVISERGASRKQHLIILFGILIPIIGTVLSAFNISIGFHRDLSPYSFAIANIFIAIGLFRFRIFGLITIARDRVLDEMEDGVIVLDKLGRVLDINDAAKKMIGVPNLWSIGQLIFSLVPEWKKVIILENIIQSKQIEFENINKGKEQILDLRITRLSDQQGDYSGHLLILRDITDTKTSERTKQSAFLELENLVAEKTEKLSNSIVRLEEEISERQRTEEGLRDSEEKMQSIFRVAPTGIGVVKDRVLLYVNPKICEMVGYTQEELIGQSARMLYPTQEEFEFVGREKYRQIAEHDSGSVETLWQRKDGSLINIILASTPIDLRDLSKGVTFTALDITDRKRSEKALRMSEERYRKIFETSEIGISTNDLNGHFTSGNPALLKMFGYTLEEYCNLTIKDISHPEDLEKDLRLSEELLAGGKSYFTIEKRNRHKNGHYIWGQLTSMLVRDDTGRPLYALGMFEDISKRKEVEDSLHEREKFIRTVIDTVPVGVFVVNKEGVITYLNPAGQNIWQGGQYVGLDDLDVYKGWRTSDGTVVKAHEWGSARAVLYGQTTLDEEIEIEAFDGTHKIISNSGIPLYDDNGNINGAVAILQDITGRKKVEKELLQSSEDLKAAYTATLQGWSHALELREHETAGHSQRVVQLTIEIARRFNFSEEEILHIQRGALLHDIGKMGIPDSILLKPGPLTESEWAIMRKHPVFAKQLLSGIPYLTHAMDIPYYHHERWNGSGYPHGLKGEEIPLAARIFAVVDVWDALNSDRPYRKGWEVKQIFNYLKENSGVLLDPDVVKVFLEIIGN